MAKIYHSFGWLAAAAAAGVLVAVGMLLLTIVGMVEPAGAAFPGKNGKIAFQCGAEICTMNPNGQGVDSLTNNSAGDSSPAWSADGNKIAFESNRDGNYEIYTMNANGQGVDRLTNNPKIDGTPAWSPDGNKIAFGSDRDGNFEIYTMNPSGQGLDRLTNNSAGAADPNWSPGGGKIAFVSTGTNNSSDIFTMSANGQGADNLTKKSSSSPDWQPLSPAPKKPGTPNKKTAPRVLSTSPKANAKAVAPKASLRATFSEKMKASSINGKTFKLVKKGSTKKLSARVTYNAATKKATLNPTASLGKGLTYKAVVTKGAKDVAGTSLDQKRTTKGLQQKLWSFTVRR